MNNFEQRVLQSWLQSHLELESTIENKVFRVLAAINFIQVGGLHHDYTK